MAAFQDVVGDEWRVTLTLGHVEAIKAETGVDLALQAGNVAELFRAVFEDPAKFAAVLWELLADQVAERQLDARQFKFRLDGPTVERATTAVLEALIDFFPRSQVAKAMKGRLRTVLEKMDNDLLSRLDGTPSPGATSSPGSSGPTPGPSPSASSPSWPPGGGAPRRRRSGRR